VSTSLLVPASAVSCYPASMLNLIWFADKNVYHVSIEQHGDMKLGISRSKNVNILQARWASALSCSFCTFFNCNCKISKICHQRTRFFTIGAG